MHAKVKISHVCVRDCEWSINSEKVKILYKGLVGANSEGQCCENSNRMIEKFTVHSDSASLFSTTILYYNTHLRAGVYGNPRLPLTRLSLSVTKYCKFTRF